MACSCEIQSQASLLIKNFSSILSSCYLLSNYLPEKETRGYVKIGKRKGKQREREHKFARPQE